MPLLPTQATPEIDEDGLAMVIELVRRRSGIELTDAKQYLVQARLASVARDQGFAGVSELCRAVAGQAGSPLEASVVEALTTNETSFFRDQAVWDEIRTQILPRLLAGLDHATPLMIWSAACSSGQEALTMAMLLWESFPDLCRADRVRIVATDLSPAMVERTRNATYSRMEMGRGLPDTFQTKYFQPLGARWQASEQLRGLIEVRELNLIDEWQQLPRFDLVLLRNVLFYFSPSTKETIVRRIDAEALKPSGELILGATERPLS